MLRHERTVHQKEIVSDKHKHIAENGNNVIRTIDFPPSIATHDALPGNQQEAAGLNSIKRPAESFRMHDAKRISYSSRFSLPRPASKMDNQNPGELDALLLLNLQPYHRLPDVPHNANSLVSDHQIPQSNTERSHILPPSPSHSSPSTDVFPTSSFNFIPPTGIIEHLSYVKENAPPFFSIFETDVINGEADDEIGDYQDGLGDNYDFLYDDNK